MQSGSFWNVRQCETSMNDFHKWPLQVIWAADKLIPHGTQSYFSAAFRFMLQHTDSWDDLLNAWY